MRRWRIQPAADTTLSAALAGDVLAGIGTPHLAASCLAAMHRVMPVTFCTVFAVDATGRIEAVSAASSYGTTAERTAERYVAQRFDLLDPNMTWLAARKLPRRAQLWLGHQRADEVADPAYRAACYGDVGIRERASTLLADATLAHGRSAMAARDAVMPTLASRLLTLSLREREVIGQLMAGRTAKEAAREIGIELTTVRTHQYRAFRRLGIRSQKELLRAAPR
jgi:DNA-binding CsgD family transcriptional regulator